MNNNIQEAYCSFEVSKLLKEKGGIFKGNLVKLDNGFDTTDSYAIIQSQNYTYIPTHALAIEWIRVNFDIFITLLLRHEEKICYDYYIEKLEITNEYKTLGPKDELEYNSPQEATEAALLYTLTNLIP